MRTLGTILAIVGFGFTASFLLPAPNGKAYEPDKDPTDIASINDISDNSGIARVYWPKFQLSPSELLLPARIEAWCRQRDRELVSMTTIRQRQLGEHIYATEIWFTTKTGSKE